MIPPLEDLHSPFILGYEIGNGTEESPIYLVVSTHGLLANAPAQA